jgi:spermidine synthase
MNSRRPRGGRASRWPLGRQTAVAVSEQAGVRYLHIGGDAIQSAMRLSRPDRLELHYTRAMMAFLLFHPRPERVLMVGLGGGSMARFLHQAFPRCRVTALEVNPDVVTAARQHFDFPPDGQRLAVVLDDGAAWVRSHPGSADVLLLDAFDDGRQVEDLCSESFYAAAFAALAEPAVLVQNFMADDPKIDIRCERIGEAFGGRVTLLRAADRVNVIALACKGVAKRHTWAELRRRAAALTEQYDLPGEHYLATLKHMNGENDTRVFEL